MVWHWIGNENKIMHTTNTLTLLGTLTVNCRRSSSEHSWPLREQMCITIFSGKCLSVSQFLRRPKTSVLFAVRLHIRREVSFRVRTHVVCSLSLWGREKYIHMVPAAYHHWKVSPWPKFLRSPKQVRGSHSIYIVCVAASRRERERNGPNLST